MEFDPIQLYSVSPSQITSIDKIPTDTQKTKVIFWGGLLHLNGIGMSGGLAEVLWDIAPQNASRPFDIYSFAVGDKDNISNLVHIGDKVTKEQNTTGRMVPSSVAKKIVDQIILPNDVCEAWEKQSPPCQQKAMEKYFDEMRFIGYSHGILLIQQAETYMREKLASYGLSHKSLERVGCVNIAAVAAATETINGEDVALFHTAMNENLHRIKSEGRFQQLFLVRKTDKIMSIRVERRFLTPNCKDFDVVKAGKIVCIGDYCGDDTLRYAGISKLASGAETPKVTEKFDHEGHALRLFTNVLKADTEKNNFTAPSSYFGTVIREALQECLKPIGQQWAYDQIPSVVSFSCPINGPQNRARAKTSLENQINQFSTFVENYRLRTFQESFDFIRNEVTRVAMQTKTNNATHSITIAASDTTKRIKKLKVLGNRRVKRVTYNGSQL